MMRLALITAVVVQTQALGFCQPDSKNIKDIETLLQADPDRVFDLDKEVATTDALKIKELGDKMRSLQAEYKKLTDGQSQEGQKLLDEFEKLNAQHQTFINEEIGS